MGDKPTHPWSSGPDIYTQDVYLTVTMLLKARQFKGFVKLICGVDALEVYFLQINLQITANENNDELT